MNALAEYDESSGEDESQTPEEVKAKPSEEEMLHLKVDSKSFQSLVKSQVGTAAPIVASKVLMILAIYNYLLVHRHVTLFLVF